MSGMSRRSFMQTGTMAGTVMTAAGLVPRVSYAAEEEPSVRLRDLGTTGHKVSEIGFGAMNTRDEELLHAAIDRGVNYIDTAHVYMNGQNEQIVGNVMQTTRDKVFLTTKVKVDQSPAQAREQLETSLKRLRVDHVDCVLLHDVSDPAIVTTQEYIDVFGTLRDRGLARFVGISMHSNATEVLTALADSGFWQMALVGYNYTSPPELTAAIASARGKGIGIVAMKNLLTSEWPSAPLDAFPAAERGELTSEQAMIKWVLEDANVDVTIPGMTAFEHLDDDLALMRMKLSFDNRRSPRRYTGNSGRNYCSGVAGCTGCREQCPNGVAVNEVNRCLGYATGYDDIELARTNYVALPVKLDQCGECSECTVTCINGLNLSERISHARTLFG